MFLKSPYLLAIYPEIITVEMMHVGFALIYSRKKNGGDISQIWQNIDRY